MQSTSFDALPVQSSTAHTFPQGGRPTVTTSSQKRLANERLVKIVVENFPLGVNIKWDAVCKEFNDPSESRQSLKRKYYCFTKDKPEARRCEISAEEIIETYFQNKDINWRLVIQIFKEKNKYKYDINPNQFKRSYQTHHDIPSSVQSPQEKVTPAVESQKQWNQEENERLLKIIVDNFPLGVNIKWDIVHELFDDPSISQKNLSKYYYKLTRYKPEVRTCVISVEKILQKCFKPDQKIDWNLVVKIFKEKNNYKHYINPNEFKKNFSNLQTSTGKYCPSNSVSNVAVKSSVKKKTRTTAKTIRANATEKTPFWTQDRENSLLAVINSQLVERTRIPWKRVESLFNHQFIFDGVSPYVKRDDLMKKFNEIQKRKNDEVLTQHTELQIQPFIFPELQTSSQQNLSSKAHEIDNIIAEFLNTDAMDEFVSEMEEDK